MKLLYVHKFHSFIILKLCWKYFNHGDIWANTNIYFGEERLNMLNTTDLGSDMFNLYAEYIMRNAGLDEA